MGILLFGLYPDYEEGDGHGLTKVEHILYQSSCRALWAVALAFVVFSCTMGKGGKRLFYKLKITNIFDSFTKRKLSKILEDNGRASYSRLLLKLY